MDPIGEREREREREKQGRQRLGMAGLVAVTRGGDRPVVTFWPAGGDGKRERESE